MKLLLSDDEEEGKEKSGSNLFLKNHYMSNGSNSNLNRGGIIMHDHIIVRVPVR